MSLILAGMALAGALTPASASAASNPFAWGLNAYGQLGNGTTTDSHTPGTVASGAIPAGVSITQLSGGYAHSLAVGSDGNAYAWGDNGYGQLGDGTTTSASTPVVALPGAIPAGVSLTQTSAGGYFSLALGSDGHAYTWGMDSSGQLGDAKTTNSNVPVAVAPGAIPAGVSLIQVSAGAFHSLALGSDGRIYAWGSNANGQLGNGTSTDSNAPLTVSRGAIPEGARITQVAAGGDHSLALTSDGNVYAWGYNGDGELGNGTTSSASTPVLVAPGAIPAGVTLTGVAGGSNHSLALGSDGHAYGWGRNGSGELGDGTTTDAEYPVSVVAGAIPAGVSLVGIEAGDHHSLGLGSDGHAYAWGDDAFGQLGNGGTTNSSAPVAVSQPAGTTFATLASGPVANHSLALVGAAARGGVIATTEGQPFSGRVLTTDCALSSGSIDWGDGTSPTAARDAGSPPGADGDHTYAEEGSFTGTVTYDTDCARALTAHFQASVADAPLSASGNAVTGTQGQALTENVAHFADADPDGAANDFSATIHWGDGSTSSGSVLAAAGGGFDVSGTHTYGAAGSFTLSTEITDAGSSAASASSTAQITTPPVIVVAHTLGVDQLTATSARAFGTVNDGGHPVTYHLEYGQSTSYGSTTPVSTTDGSGTDRAVEAELSWLAPDSEYHVRVVATAPTGPVYGEDVAFHTARAASALPGLPAGLDFTWTPRADVQVAGAPAGGIQFQATGMGVSYQWAFDSPPASAFVADPAATGDAPRHSFTADGAHDTDKAEGANGERRRLYTVRLRATAANGASVEVSHDLVVVPNAPPLVDPWSAPGRRLGRRFASSPTR